MLSEKDKQAGVHLQATERFVRASTTHDRRTARTVQVRQEHGPRQHDSGAVPGLLRKDLHSFCQRQRRQQLEAVKKYTEKVMKVPVDREQVYFEDWNEAALRRIINQQRKITEKSHFACSFSSALLRVVDAMSWLFKPSCFVCTRTSSPRQLASGI